MYFSKAFITSALLGAAAATTHAGEAPAAHTVSALQGHSSAAKVAAPSAHATPVVQNKGHNNVAAEGTVVTHVVQVGGPNGTLRFYPDNVIAKPGELVQFQFNPKNHSVVQSTFDQPCIPIQNVMPNKTDAFFSGFMPTNRSLTAGDYRNVLTYTIRVTNTNPIWYYCSQGQHCQGGMVGAINAPTSGERTVVSYAAGAKLAQANLSPGQQPGAASPSSGPSAGAPVPSSPSSNNPAGANPSAGAGQGSPTASAGPAEASVNAAPGLVNSARQSFMGLGLGGFVAFMLL